eukprot:TRINITY_DN63580_c0_g1_i1.p1 TRINITY_DN63580_c0_g1~~TRINITY_DN63580_c0_g1_i1.p1  ORF type:complete len:614 (-),score=83.16 TRINITY_DN63580_c0_g1_i1:100-1941(-)
MAMLEDILAAQMEAAQTEANRTELSTAPPLDLEPMMTSIRVPKQVWQYQCDGEDEDCRLPMLSYSRPQIRPTVIEDKAFALEHMLGEEVHTGPLAWIEDNLFQSIVGFVILLNAIFIGLETDVKSKWWIPVEHGVTLFFSIELSLRLWRYGFLFFGYPGNIFDFCVCVSGMIDMWVMPLVQLLSGKQEEEGGENPVLKLMQMLRLLRIVRLIRLVKMIGPLYNLAAGIAEALQGMVWVLVFLVMLLYATSIVTTRTLGSRSHVFPEHSTAPEEHYEHVKGLGLSGNPSVHSLRTLFDTVPASMFSLFESMSCWSLMVFEPLFSLWPVSRVLAVIFYIFSNWALLAVMTGVVSEKMLAVKESITSGEEQKQNDNEEMTQVLIELFRKADADGSGYISRAEFNHMLLCPELMRPLVQHSVLDAQDFSDLFDWLDRDKDETVKTEEFIAGFHWLHEHIEPKSLLKLEEKLSTHVRMITKRLCAFAEQRFDDFFNAVSGPLRKIAAVVEQIERIDAALEIAQNCTKEVDNYPQGIEIDELERRFTQKIVRIDAIIDKIAMLQEQGMLVLDEDEIKRQEEYAMRSPKNFARSDSHSLSNKDSPPRTVTFEGDIQALLK